MPGADVEYTATLNDTQVLHALRIIARATDELESESNKHFKRMEQIMTQRIGKGAKQSALKIGTIQGTVQELTRRFINLAEQAARAFVQIAAGGVKLSKQLELTQIALTNVLGGNQEAAEAFLETTRDTARRLRTDYVELAQLAATILPQANDIEATNQLLEQAIILGKQAGQNATGIRIALQEALAGQFVSLQRRLNVPASSVARIKELSEEIGLVPALVEVLGDRVEELGLSLESTADTAAAAFATLEAEGKKFQQVLGEPILEELKNQANGFLDVLETKGVSIERAAIAFGELAASVLELIGSNLQEFLLSLDFEQIEATADALNDTVAALDALVAILDAVPDVNQDLQDTRTIIEALADGLRFAAESAAILKAFLAGLPDLGPLLTISTGGVPDPERLVNALKELGTEGVFNQEAYNESLEQSAKIIFDLNKTLEENAEKVRQRHEEQDKDNQSALDAAQAYLDEQQALKELAQAESEAAAAREKLSEKLGKLAIDRERELADIYRDQARELFEDELKFAQKREDLARDNADQIEDIWRDHQDELADAARDLTRDEEDIYRKAARDRVEADRDGARERLSIETDYRRELERIRARFEESAEEAERRNDAQAFLEAVRQRDRDITEAKRTRSEQLEDASQRAAEQRERAREQLQYEIEDARIANRRKLEDLKIRLERELEAQRTNYERDLEEQALTEERKRAERQRANQQELEDFARKEAERLQDLNQSLSTEFETIRKYEDLKRQYRVQSAQRTVAEVNAALARLNPFGSDVPQLTPRQRVLGLEGGGRLSAHQPAIVGEAGPELIIPDRGIQVVPLPAPAAAAQSINNSRSIDVGGISVGEDMFSSPVMTRKFRNVVLTILAEAL